MWVIKKGYKSYRRGGRRREITVQKRRGVVTGMGMITPLGIGVEASWKALCAGESGIARITKFDPTDYPAQISAEVRGFNPSDFIQSKEIKKMDAFIHFAVASARMAIEDAGLKITAKNATRVGVYIGPDIDGLPAIEHWYRILLEKGPKRVTPFFIPMTIINLASGQVSIALGAKGPNSCAVTTCATGNNCIWAAFQLIQGGDADVMIAGGTEAAITPLAMAGFAASRALSLRNHEPTGASRPFDRDRDGFVLGEGAGVLVLEELENAKKRDSKIYAEIVGCGMTADVFHLTAPPKDGEGAARCMKIALSDAGIKPEEVNTINAHATSTMADAIETTAIKTVFEKAAYQVPIRGTRSITGHLRGIGFECPALPGGAFKSDSS